MISQRENWGAQMHVVKIILGGMGISGERDGIEVEFVHIAEK